MFKGARVVYWFRSVVVAAVGTLVDDEEEEEEEDGVFVIDEHELELDDELEDELDELELEGVGKKMGR